jgi:DNA repair photolyase
MAGNRCGEPGAAAPTVAEPDQRRTLFNSLEVRAQSYRSAKPGLPVLDQRLRGTKFVELPTRTVINAPESTGMGFWSINPYVGCEFGCSYCYARYAHRYVVERARDGGRITQAQFADLGAPKHLEPFEHRIFVKTRDSVLAALERDLRRVRRRSAEHGAQNIVIGTATDPYQPAERQYQLTRAILDRLRRERDLTVGIITKSTLVCRDIDLLVALAGHNHVSVYVSLISVDPRITDLFEARSPVPHARLRALRKLTAAGIRTGLIVAPVLPGITDSTEQVDALMHAAHDAGAYFVNPAVLRLYPAVKNRFLPIVERHFPELAERYRKRYGLEWDAPEEYARALKRRFRMIAERYGISDTERAGEQLPKDLPTIRVTQLSLL